MSTKDILTLLEKRNIAAEFPEYANDLQTVAYLEAQMKAARESFNAAEDSLQQRCAHPILLETSRLHMGRIRECYVCKLRESQPVVDPGDEYDYATYGSFKVLTGNFYATIKDSDREVYRVSQG